MAYQFLKQHSTLPDDIDRLILSYITISDEQKENNTLLHRFMLQDRINLHCENCYRNRTGLLHYEYYNPLNINRIEIYHLCVMCYNLYKKSYGQTLKHKCECWITGFNKHSSYD